MARAQGVGFDDFVKDRAVRGSLARGGRRSGPAAVSFESFVKDVNVRPGAAQGPVTGFEHFLKRLDAVRAALDRRVTLVACLCWCALLPTTRY